MDQLKRAESEKMLSSAKASALMILGAAAAENMRALGVYHAHNRAPVPHLMNEYIDLREALAKENLVPARRRNWGVIDKLESDILAIPLETVWKDKALNLVTTVGKGDLLDKYIAGSTYTAAWFMLLIGNTSYTTGPAAGDTASSHGGWTESTAYSNANRPTPAWSAAAAGSKATSSGVVFNINGSDTIKGCGLITNNTKGGTTGILLSAGTFSGGDQPVANTNTLSVTYSLAV